MPFQYGNPVTITFNSTNWRYWYPKKTCDYQNNSDFYNNTYLFDGGSLNNLYINDYEIDNHKNYPIIRSTGPSTYFASTTINYCSFMNITSFMTTSLFSSNNSLYIDNITFLNIVSFGTIFYVDSQDYMSLACAASLFQNVSAPFIFNSNAAQSKITYCQFLDIICTETAFYDGATSSIVDIENSIIDIND